MAEQALEKAAKLITEQAEKLGKALSSLRKITKVGTVEEAKKLSSDTLREIADYGKNPKDL